MAAMENDDDASGTENRVGWAVGVFWKGYTNGAGVDEWWGDLHC